MNKGIPCAIIFRLRSKTYREWHVFAQVPRQGEGIRLASQDLIVNKVFWMKHIEADNPPGLTNTDVIFYPIIYAELSRAQGSQPS